MGERFTAALLGVHQEPAAAPQLSALGVRRFAAVSRRDYGVLADLDRIARGAGYPLPA
jgi:hypothetical protein